ncbi:MAG: c-type cytochrome [Gammaproteobacteria bacterium]|nr:c-type cytochrome [Gammaproteobacteria bacterium]
MKITQILTVAGILILTNTASIADGKSDYESKCSACHGFGVAGAPKLGDPAVWADRIAQGNEKLYDNAINGFSGTAGVMPPKGGFSALSDEETKAIVDYMVSQSQ